MSAMFRVVSVLMMLLVGMPFVRDCCLPVTHSLPCHESKHTDDTTCASGQQAIAATKTALGISSSIEYVVQVANAAKSAILTRVRRSLEMDALAARPAIDIYLRTGTLLI